MAQWQCVLPAGFIVNVRNNAGHGTVTMCLTWWVYCQGQAWCRACNSDSMSYLVGLLSQLGTMQAMAQWQCVLRNGITVKIRHDAGHGTVTMCLTCWVYCQGQARCRAWHSDNVSYMEGLLSRSSMMKSMAQWHSVLLWEFTVTVKYFEGHGTVTMCLTCRVYCQGQAWWRAWHNDNVSYLEGLLPQSIMMKGMACWQCVLPGGFTAKVMMKGLAQW